MTVPVEPCQHTHLHVVQRTALTHVIEHLLAQRAPKALHLATRLRVVRPRVCQPDVEPAASGGERLAGIGRAVVEVEAARPPREPHRAGAQHQHVDLALGVARFEGDDIAAVIVEDGMDPQRLLGAIDDDG